MDLFEEELLKPKKKTKVKIKTTTVLIALIIILILLCFVIMAAITHLRGKILTIKLDGNDASDLKSIFIIEEDNKVYIPIRRMGEYLGYETHNGDYIMLSEDATKCYVERPEGIVSFTLDSNIIYKVSNEQTEQVNINEPIKEINGELYITAEGAQDAFDFIFTFDVEKNKMTIETLSYVYNRYANYYGEKGYILPENETYNNKLALFDGFLIVMGSNENYGVITTEGDILLETKYKSIEYLRKNSDFLVSNGSKMGIISKDRETKVGLTYDNIEKVTDKNEVYYIVRNSNLFGVLNEEGKIIIHPEYTGIGINIAAYSKNGIANGYILYNKLIPVNKDNKWALFNTEGQKITDFIYDGFGSTANKANTYAVLEVKDYELIVAKQGDKYNLINTDGKGIFNGGFVLDSVYITTVSGKTDYYITYGEQEIKLLEYLEKNWKKE